MVKFLSIFKAPIQAVKQWLGMVSRVGLAALVLLMAGSGTPAVAHASRLQAAAVKAALVLNFAKFTTWPVDAFSGPDAPIELLVFGDAAHIEAFAGIDGRAVGMRKIRVRLMKSGQSADNCHMMFFDQSVDRARLTSILAETAKRPVLTIGERPDFIQSGGIINLFNKNERFHFEIRPAAANMRDIKISSRLLKLAIILDE